MAWLSTGTLTPPEEKAADAPQAETPEPAEAMPWLNTDPLAAAPESLQEAEFSNAGWLSETPDQAEPESVGQTTSGLDSGIDWLDSMDSMLADAASTSAPTGSSSLPPESPRPQGKRSTTSQLGDSGKDWMSSRSDAQTPSESAQPAEAGSDWMSTMFAADANTEPAATPPPAEAEVNFDWIGNPAPAEPTADSLPTAQPAEA